MNFFRSFPLLVLPILLYNVLVLASPWSAADAAACADVVGHVVHPVTCSLQETWFQVPMGSSLLVGDRTAPDTVQWAVSVGDGLLVLSLVLLFAELLKSTGIQASSIVNHALSFIVFVLGLVQFLLFPPFATSVFFLITLMTVLDVLAGFIVTISAARRDFNLTR